MFELRLTDQMVAVIAEALSNHRFRDAAPVIQEMQRQINEQRPLRPPTNVKNEQPSAS